MAGESNIRGILVPHAPTLLEDDIDGRPSPVIRALRDIGQQMKDWGVEAVVAASTHWQSPEFCIDTSLDHETITDYYGFRREINYDVSGHPSLAGALLEAGQRNLIFPIAQRRGVDHAITIPLHFMFPDRDIPVIPLSVSGSILCSFRWGRILGNTLKTWGGKVLFLASGSLSHDLSCFVSGKRKSEHELFDHEVLKFLSAGKGMDILNLDKNLIEVAKPEGALRDLCMLLGVMGSQTRGKVRAYENLPGVGLGVVEFLSSGYNEMDEELLKNYQANRIVH